MIKHSDLIIHEQTPFNAEPPLKLLRQFFITPKELFYVRNHGSIPEVDLAEYRLSITGSVSKQLSLSLDEIREKFPKHTVMASLQCAGNRRDGLIQIKPIPGEEPWQAQVLESPSPWAWRFWQSQLELNKGCSQIIVRAWDCAGNSQPEDARTIWNFKGYMNNSWHRVEVKNAIALA